MSKASLYVNSKGYEVSRHSYSGSSEFQHCPRLYYLKRVAGWSERSQSAAMEFGNAVEAGHREFHTHDLESALKVFSTKWNLQKDDARAERKLTPLDYSEKLENWDSCFQTGQEMLKLYALRYPRMPFVISDPSALQAQRTYEVFPGSDLAGIELISYMDIVAKLKAGAVDPTLEDDRIILDMKVSAAACPSLVSLDPQLRTYSMVEKIPTVGFLWFGVKSRSLKKGDYVTVLQSLGEGEVSPGKVVVVLALDADEIPLSPPSLYVVDSEKILDEFETIKGQSKEAKAARIAFRDQRSRIVPISAITRQEVEVVMATISEESREDMRKQIENDVIRIHAASKNDFWPMQSGVRFPHNPCPMCSMRGICSGNEKLRDELVVRLEETII
jgi:hypothetical protein